MENLIGPKQIGFVGETAFMGFNLGRAGHDIGGRPLARCSPGRGVRVRARAQLVQADMQKSVAAISYEELEVKGPNRDRTVDGTETEP